MRTDIKTALSQNGFVLVPNFLASGMLENLRRVSASILAGLAPEHREKFKSTGSLCNFGDHPEYAEIVAHPAVATVMSRLGFDTFKWLSGYLISKPGHSPPLFWHQDWWGWSNEVSYQVKPLGLAFMYYLSDTVPENGCLRVIPGSHRNWHELHGLPDAHDDDLGRAKNLDSPAYQSHPDELAVTVSAGDLVIMDSRLLHSAYPNNTDAERSLLTLWYNPEYDKMPDGIRHQFAKIFERTALDIDGDAVQPKSPLDWPEDRRKMAQNLFPICPETSGREIWSRRPDRTRMRVPVRC